MIAVAMTLKELRVKRLLKLGIIFLSCAVLKSDAQGQCQRRCHSQMRFYQRIGLRWDHMYQECLDTCAGTVQPLPFGVVRPNMGIVTAAVTAATTTNPTPTSSMPTTTTTTSTTTTTTPTTTTTTPTTTTITSTTTTTIPTTTTTTPTTTTPTPTTTTTTPTTTPTTTTITPTTTTTTPTTTTTTPTTTPTTTTTTPTTTTTTPTTTTTTPTTTTQTTTTSTTPSTTSATPTTTTTMSRATSTTTRTTRMTTTTVTSHTDAVCGRQSPGLDRPRDRVIGGVTADECEYPWMVLIVVANSICGGSILDKRHIMTAAHCVKDKMTNAPFNTTRVHVRIGSSSAALALKFPVVSIRTHPNHDPVNKINDIAVVTLGQDLVFSNCTLPICLPEEGSDPSQAEFCVVAGWGVTDVRAPNSIPYLQEVVLPLVDQQLCQARYGEGKVNEQTFCAGDYYSGGVDSCQGDSGGPLMCKVEGRFVAHGIVSNGLGCALATYPGIYTRVAHPNNLRFVKSIIGTS